MNQGQATFAGLTESPAPYFGWNATNDGSAATNTSKSSFWFANSQPNTLTFLLDTTVGFRGYDIEQIQTVAGWYGVTQSQANQDFELFVRELGSDTFISLGSFSYTPFPDSDTSGSYGTRITLTDDTGVIASGVDAVRFTFAQASFAGTTGTVVREIDIDGVAFVPEPCSFLVGSLLIGLGIGLGRRRRK